MLSKSFGHISLRNNLLNTKHHPASNTAAVVTLAAPGAGFRYVLHGMQWSYDVTPTSGSLGITINAVTKFAVDIVTAGPGGLGVTLVGGINEAMVLTLTAGGSGVVGKINVQYTLESTKSK